LGAEGLAGYLLGPAVPAELHVILEVCVASGAERDMYHRSLNRSLYVYQIYWDNGLSTVGRHGLDGPGLGSQFRVRTVVAAASSARSRAVSASVPRAEA
jgi:hypothetical protein